MLELCADNLDIQPEVSFLNLLGMEKGCMHGVHKYSSKLCRYNSILIGSIARVYGTSSQGTGPILLYNVLCSGTETRLLECPNTALDVGSCGHTEDAGVTCMPGKKTAGFCAKHCNPVILKTTYMQMHDLLCKMLTHE